MIEAKELRIGSIVNHTFKRKQYACSVIEIRLVAGGYSIHCKYLEPIELKFEGIVTVEIEPFYLNPIPLTEEWLLKFGIKPYHKTLVDGTDVYTLHESIYAGIFIYPKRYDPEFSVSLRNGNVYHPIVGIAHVHQLQNLYFALTGEELTINK